MIELEKLISIIQQQYIVVNDSWFNSEEYFPMNMNKNRVDDVYKDDVLLLNIFKYRMFINDNIADMVELIQNQKFSNAVSSRVKALNSIQFKIENYEFNHENGKIPLKKCLNDIFGIRMIFNDNINYDEMLEKLKLLYPSLKCIKSERGEYIAIHIYFGNDCNFNFQWELQIWDKKHEQSNFDSHNKYKQSYTKWERENKFEEVA